MHKVADHHTKIYSVECEREIAFESPDHLMPWGTSKDNTKNQRFNDKLYVLYQGLNHPLHVLDMGCSGGGFVKNCIDDGCIAIGLEGSDFSKLHRRAEWKTIPEYLFTCDITGHFQVMLDVGDIKEAVKFDVITAWDFIEHIAEEDLHKVALNVKNHLREGGIWLMSVATNEDVLNGVRLHQTVQPRSWWIDKFSSFGFQHCEEYVRYFNTQFVRGGPKYGGDNFILALTLDAKKLPVIPVIGMAKAIPQYLLDKFIGSAIQKALKKAIIGY